MRSDVPTVGQHANDVLHEWLGLADTHAQALRQSGALGSPE
jgi:crotonobetainyl-CoA:carnitine CoA-transferase CaiB-like acyl-CoA transferase